MDPLVHLGLLVQRGTDPVAGWVELAPGQRLPFTGYLEFMALIERLMAAPAEVSTPVRHLCE